MVSLDQLLAGKTAEDVKVETIREIVVRKKAQLNEEMMSQLMYIISGPYYFGDVSEVDDCFKERIVDDGVVFYKEMKSIKYPNLRFYYWLGYFGGNPTGYLLLPSGESVWDVVIENCDTDFIWRAKGDTPKDFVKSVKMAAYGDKYNEDEDS